MKARRDDCLIIDDGRVFLEDDVVKVGYWSSYNQETRYIEGRIERIETLEITIDVSEKYNSDYRKYKIDQLKSIVKTEKE